MMNAMHLIIDVLTNTRQGWPAHVINYRKQIGVVWINCDVGQMHNDKCVQEAEETGPSPTISTPKSLGQRL